MVYSLHPNNSFRAGFLVKHLAIIVPLTIPPIIIFSTKGNAMLAGDPMALLFLLPALVSLIVPHIIIRRMHLRILRETPSNGSIIFEDETIKWKAGDKTQNLNRSEIQKIEVVEKLLHRFAFGQTGYAFLRLHILDKNGKSFHFLVANKPLDGGNDLIEELRK
ncbi:MAG: hypothetical protein JJU02_14375 [Cryomorphaceae bacterium]|nr:hypothetical protein [Cryomorphaceae bacterium]